MKTINKVLLTLTVIGSLSIASANGPEIYNTCIACHGDKGEKKALGRSEIIQGWDSNKTVAAIKGYKDGTYGGTVKVLMESKVISLSDEEIEEIAKFIQMQK